MIFETIEKLKMSNRLDELELNVTHLTSQLEEFQTNETFSKKYFTYYIKLYLRS